MPSTKSAPSKAKKSAAPTKATGQGKTSGQEKAAAQGNSQLDKYFTDSLKDIYWAEKNLTKALPKMQKAATTEELKNAIEEHLAQTEEHITRLEQVFEIIGKKAQAKKCEAMDGII